MKRFLFFVLLGAVFAQARITLDYSTDRIEAGANFDIRLNVPLRELADVRDVPKFVPQNGFTLRGMDSTDTRIEDFFGRGYPIRQYSFKLTAPAKTGRRIAGIITWKVSGQEYEISRPAVDVQKSYDDAAVNVSLTPSKKTVYEGEQLSVSLSIHTFEHFQGSLSATSMDIGNDFIAHRSDLSELKLSPIPDAPRETQGSAKFAWLSPLKAGSVSIPAFKFKYMKVGKPKVVEKNQSHGGFSMSFKSIQQEPEEAEAKTAPVNITVLPLPSQNKPKDFTGMVGTYNFKASFDKDSLTLGDALTLSIQISGDGKPGTITDPVLPSFSDFRSVPPETELKKKVSGGKVITTKNIRLFLYPKKKGEFEIPEITYNWFNPSKKKYETKTEGPWKIVVEKGEASATAYTQSTPNFTAPAKEEIEDLGRDIRYMHSISEVKALEIPLYKSAPFWILLCLPIPLYAIFCAFVRSHRKHSSNAALVRKAKAKKNLKQYTAAAKSALQKNDGKAFYAALENGLIGYLSDLSNREFRGMTKNQVLQNLTDLGVSEENIQKVLQWQEACAFARFAPVDATAEERAKALQEFENLCDALEVLK
ncbi:MAG: protein BatD [Fibrobacter sp.]|nr:protein BatD [Fibrobacter sp.]